MKTTRREFLTTAASLSAMAVTHRRLFAQATLEQRLAHDPLRPQFHLLPARNWMNDPNGPIYFNGRYHMFFQYNPQGPTWGDMSWNHAISRDMVHWTLEPVALTPTPNSPDSFGVFSGSAIAVPYGNARRVYAVYTGTQKSDDAHATIRDGANNVQESQCLAWSDDPLLIRWTKDPQPIIPAPPAGLAITGFRDPSIWRQGDWYYMTVGSGIARVGGCVLLYRSPAKGDLKQWEYLHPLTSGEWNGKVTSNPCDDGEMWECPEFFALGNSHVLIYSTLGKVFWQSGSLDATTMRFTPKKSGELDWGAFYAPKTQLDAQGRRILWGWIPEKRSEDAMRSAGWSGMMSLPRVMSLDPDGTLRLTIADQVHGLRSTPLRIEANSSGIATTLPAANGELLCSGTPGKSFQLRLGTQADPALLKVEYLADRNVFLADGKEIALQPGDAPTVHAYIDGSVIEMILGQRIGLTRRFYYTGPAPDISVIVESKGESAKLEAWKIAPISGNRMTTTATTQRRTS